MPAAAGSRSDRVQYWDLPTGSRIAYVRFAGSAPVRPQPVIFLHGGPGAFIVDHPSVADHFYQSLARIGFDLYLYDQIGSGRSARLSDPRQYTVDRHIRDLEAIRQKLRAGRVILIGDSWGASLGANYIAEHPNRSLLYVREAGHAFGYDQPRIYSSAVEAFLLDRPLPVSPYTTAVPPPRLMPRAVMKEHE
jgi:pimeloyl-ACP methyl ester carboxylesterase